MIIERQSQKNIEVEIPTPTTFIYRITNTETSQCYVGRTCDVGRRIDEHLQAQGSIALLHSLVDYGIDKFKFEVLDSCCSHDEQLLGLLEDYYILQSDGLLPAGFNQRLNRSIEPNGELVDLSQPMQLHAKHVFSRAGMLYFSVGEWTSARSYQVLANIASRLHEGAVTKKEVGGHKYYQVRVRWTPEAPDYNRGERYDLQLTYTFPDDYLCVSSTSN